MDHHIDHHFDEALDALRHQVTLMSSKIQGMVADAMRALEARDVGLAGQIVERDHAVNALEVAIDEHCLELLVRYQPAASDLRFITRCLKVVTDLERVGDLAVNISKRVGDFLDADELPVDLGEISAVVQRMLKDSVDAFAQADEAKADAVLRDDDIVDALTERHVSDLIARTQREPQSFAKTFPVSSIVRYLERVADHSTNIAEMAIFLARGMDVRHNQPR